MVAGFHGDVERSADVLVIEFAAIESTGEGEMKGMTGQKVKRNMRQYIALSSTYLMTPSSFKYARKVNVVTAEITADLRRVMMVDATRRSTAWGERERGRGRK